MTTEDAAHTNRLIRETSPYLIQHAHNPVDWYPWGDAALDRAREDDMPILLSIGYSACHWCHVMERESFENDNVAAIMNENFVCIKVDREERPDLDALYMLAVQAMTGRGGWPMTVFLAPDLRPFYGGTYFPPEDRHNIPGFPRVLMSIAQLYRDDRANLEQRATELEGILRKSAQLPAGNSLPDVRVLKQAATQLSAQFDRHHGGFSTAPKFPQPSILDFLLRYYHRTRDDDSLEMATVTLRKMANGGIFDHLGGGFHRYSTDERWLAPHFEKMLYDNALLPPVYIGAYQVTGDAFYADVARGCLDYVLRDMQGNDGGFYSAEDADSEGEEGKFYVWSEDEVNSLLDESTAVPFRALYGVTDYGNWEGANILNVREDPATVAERLGVSGEALRTTAHRGRETLLAARAQRVRPGLDDKVLTSWNGLMIAAMAQGAAVLDANQYLESAKRAARFILESLGKDGRLLRTYRNGRAQIDGFLEDYAYFARGLLDLFDASQEVEWLREADRLARQMCALFWDEEHGGFFTTHAGHERLPARLKDSHDGATPSANAVAVGVLLRLSVLTGDPMFSDRARDTLKSFAASIEGTAHAFTEMLAHLDAYTEGLREIVIVGARDDEATNRAVTGLRRLYLPNHVLIVHDPAQPDDFLADTPLIAGKSAIDGRTSFYVCRRFVCEAPTTDVDTFLAQLA